MGRVQGFQISRGRPSEFEVVSAGTASLTCDNSDGFLDPTNTDSPYYGNLLPLTQAKINMAHPFTGVFYDLFTGYSEELQQVRPEGSVKIMTTTIPLTDGFEILANAQLNAVGGRTRDTTTSLQKGGAYYAAQHVDARFMAALDDAGWPTQLRRISTGNVNVQNRTYDSDGNILEICQEAGDAEFVGIAQFFMDKGGSAAFSGRKIRFTSLAEAIADGAITTYPDWVKIWRVGDSGAMSDDDTLLPIHKANFAWTFGKETVYNDVIVLPAGVDASDVPNNRIVTGASRTRYGSRALSYTDIIVLSGYDPDFTEDAVTVCADIAQYYADNYAVPHQRITSIEFRMQMAMGHDDDLGPALCDFMLQVEINHLIQVYTQNPGGGGFTGEWFFVEGIHYTCSALNNKFPNLVMNLDLSPAAKYTSFP